MRGREYRRWREEIVVKKRLRVYAKNYGPYRWYSFRDANLQPVNHPTWINLIGTEDNFKAKSHTTDYQDTRHTRKYSANRNKNHFRGIRGKNKTTREYEKKEFRKILIENELKHVNTR